MTSSYGWIVNENSDFQKYHTEVIAILINDTMYSMQLNGSYSLSKYADKIFNSIKIRDFKKHEDGIIDIEIIE